MKKPTRHSQKRSAGHLFTPVAWSVALAMVLGCGATDVGNPTTDTDFQFAGYSTNAPYRNALTLASRVVIYTARIKVEAMPPSVSHDCLVPEEQRSAPMVVDLATGTTDAELSLSADDGAFCLLRFRLIADDVEGQGEGLVGQSLYVSGRNASDEPFTLSLDSEHVISVPVYFAEGQGKQTYEIAFYLADWFTPTLFEALAEDLNERNAREIFRNNVMDSIRLHYDENRDGTVVLAERQRPLALSLSAGFRACFDVIGSEEFCTGRRSGNTVDEQSCTDGIDGDDHMQDSNPPSDGLVDCDDPDCMSFGACIEGDRPEECEDGVDNDEDGLVDCSDPGCTMSVPCRTGP